MCVCVHAPACVSIEDKLFMSHLIYGGFLENSVICVLCVSLLHTTDILNRILNSVILFELFLLCNNEKYKILSVLFLLSGISVNMHVPIYLSLSVFHYDLLISALLNFFFFSYNFLQ